MANGVQDLKSIPLQDILGAPISALVQAEAQASRTALQFIEEVGFIRPADAPPDVSALDVGELRMVEFGYTKLDADGNPAHFIARIPLLALFNIPGMRVKLATLSFTAKITDVFTETTSQTTEGEVGGETPEGEGSFLTRPQLGFRGSLVSSSGSQNTTTSSYDLNIKVELEQTPISPGMAKLQSMLDLAISDSQVLTEGGEGGGA
ncbi:DUF2589 domain-containing protein [Paraliomyxa miuraensis]|uniref:DUF2589 domain-containing protein n=1 Tax=Paraliomyxa miuraensis TaxID=376150 RepID=UPI00224F20F0|nr:DUF2589 domain-containing protein [Paraliomyxa miuraensis]MCX4244712.1 DUF2589 domain-containing protein [Paraliomyxa miuraensis]